MNIYVTGTGAVNNIDAQKDESKIGVADCLYCLEPDYKEYIPDAGARRRMSRAVKTGFVSAVRCLNSCRTVPDAIITASGLGCLGDTEKFLKTIIENNEQLLNPTPFIQSTFNTVGARIAIAQKNSCYNMTYVHRGLSFESAVIDACMRINEGAAQNVLVGSFDEITETSFEILRRMGFWRHGCVYGEGSHFFVLSSQPSSNSPRLRDTVTVFSDSPDVVQNKFESFLNRNNINRKDIDLILSGETAGKQYVGFKDVDCKKIEYKRIFGEYQTVSAAGVWAGVKILTGDERIRQIFGAAGDTVNRILVYGKFANKNHSFVLLETCET